MRNAYVRLVLVAMLVAACATTPPDTVSPPASSSGPIALASASPAPTATASAVPTASLPPPPTPRPTPADTAAPVPAKPTGVTFTTDSVKLPALAGRTRSPTRSPTRSGGRHPASQGAEIKVYGVTECLSEPSDPPPGPADRASSSTRAFPLRRWRWRPRHRRPQVGCERVAPFNHDCGRTPVAQRASTTRQSSSRPTTPPEIPSSRSRTPASGGRAGPDEVICSRVGPVRQPAGRASRGASGVNRYCAPPPASPLRTPETYGARHDIAARSR